jgi:hypothetical protein
VGTTTTLAACLAAVCLHPVEDMACDRVDVIEVNHFYDEKGSLVFDQIIFYDWSPAHSRYQVRDWKLLKTPAQIPHRNWRRREFVAVWHDGEVLRRVRAKTICESWTQHDPELTERDFLPKEKRRELRNLRLAKLIRR